MYYLKDNGKIMLNESGLLDPRHRLRTKLNETLFSRPDEPYDYMRRYLTYFGNTPNSSVDTILWLNLEDSLKRHYHR